MLMCAGCQAASYGCWCTHAARPWRTAVMSRPPFCASSTVLCKLYPCLHGWQGSQAAAAPLWRNELLSQPPVYDSSSVSTEAHLGLLEGGGAEVQLFYAQIH